MIAVKDATVLIHLAKVSLLEKSCKYFGKVIIPELVLDEVNRGADKGYADASIIAELVKRKSIEVKKAKAELVKKCNLFNVHGGEAEAVSLYWQERADFLATDDDNVRKKSLLLGIRTVGTLAILLKLAKAKFIAELKFREAVAELGKVGWFSQGVLDKASMEGLK